ncbi:hypothetical protein GCM10017044_20360 [Kordiimonas sediminis]|uniref:Orc1-like AAA ATPase domain-containing protein n=1 Tax=Kordiimonas sediminis TaxID=1735581 RepID=A0A919ATX2_9PROT|nr:AAA family ATPase [Kordiimonas sediminis]GHF25479.1 hypothetical protein GCM10017044_20360 [Kordiimonas sediminis]
MGFFNRRKRRTTSTVNQSTTIPQGASTSVTEQTSLARPVLSHDGTDLSHQKTISDNTSAPQKAETVPQNSEKEQETSKTTTRTIDSIRFRTLASDRPNKEAVTDDALERARIALREVMAPSAPVQNKAYFAGRTKELERAISAIEDERMHLVVYGKRGWGKTSFTNTLTSIAKEAGYIVCRSACTQATTFSGLFRTFLKSIPLLHDRSYLAAHGADNANLGFDTLLPDDDFTSKELTDVLVNLSSTRILFVLDEFDRANLERLKYQIAETIKSFSDNSIRATLIIVGVADTLNDLLGIHESIQRNIAGIPMRLLSTGEFDELINIGEAGTGLRYSPIVRECISDLSRKVPHFARLLCLHAGQHALVEQRWDVSMHDLHIAVEQACMDIGPLLDPRHRKVLMEFHTPQAKGFLYGMSSVPINQEGDFTLDDAVEEYEKIIKAKVTKLALGSKLSAFTKPEVGLLTKLEKDGKSTYRLSDPLTGFYLRLKQYLGD